MEIVYTDGADKRFIELCKELDNYLNDTVGVQEQKGYDQYNTLEDIHDVVLILNNGQAVACGSFKEFDKESAELKRVFVKSSERHKGLGRIIVNTVEKKAGEKGYDKLILETGMQMKPAQNMYKSIGFYIRENFGQYKEMSNSVCMEKYIGIESLQEYLYKLEIELLKPEVRKSAERLRELLANDYREFCCSGWIAGYNEGDTCYEPNVSFETKDFQAVELASDYVQVTYKVKKKYEETGVEKYSNRSSIWRCYEGKWKMFFHQGTSTSEY